MNLIGVNNLECIFCNKERLNPIIVYEDELVLAFMDTDPINEGHILLIPKEHCIDVDEIPDEVLTNLMLISKRIVTALKDIYKPDGYSIMQNGGEINDIGHYHLHIFPRYKGDGFGWTYAENTVSVNAEIADMIKEKLAEQEL